MEVEVKLRLPDSTAHEKLTTLLSPYLIITHAQENLFFDTPQFHLASSSSSSALRLRFYDLDTRCVLALKSKPTISNGISRVEELEETLDPYVGRACVSHPDQLLLIKGSNIMERVRKELVSLGVEDEGLVCLGGFKNIRQVFDWEGLRLEVDETAYEFGISYEVECESSKEPEGVKYLIEVFLRDNGIPFSYSHSNKFAVFMSGKLPL